MVALALGAEEEEQREQRRELGGLEELLWPAKGVEYCTNSK